MKICDTCQRQYADSLQYCLEDGTVLTLMSDPQATLRLELTTTDPKIEVTDDLTKGVVTGRAKSRGHLRRVLFTDSYFYRNSFEKRQGRWQLVNGVSWH